MLVTLRIQITIFPDFLRCFFEKIGTREHLIRTILQKSFEHNFPLLKSEIFAEIYLLSLLKPIVLCIITNKMIINVNTGNSLMTIELTDLLRN